MMALPSYSVDAPAAGVGLQVSTTKRHKTEVLTPVKLKELAAALVASLAGGQSDDVVSTLTQPARSAVAAIASRYAAPIDQAAETSASLKPVERFAARCSDLGIPVLTVMAEAHAIGGEIRRLQAATNLVRRGDQESACFGDVDHRSHDIDMAVVQGHLRGQCYSSLTTETLTSDIKTLLLQGRIEPSVARLWSANPGRKDQLLVARFRDERPSDSGELHRLADEIPPVARLSSTEPFPHAAIVIDQPIPGNAENLAERLGLQLLASRTCTDPQGLHTQYQRLVQLARHLPRLTKSPISHLADLAHYEYLMDGPHAAEAGQSLVEAVLGPVLAVGGKKSANLLATLEVAVKASSAKDVAARAGLNLKTVYKRLGELEEITGIQVFGSSDERFRLGLAVRIRQVT